MLAILSFLLILYCVTWVWTSIILAITFKWIHGLPDSYWRGVRQAPRGVAWGLIWPYTLWKIFHDKWRLKEEDPYKETFDRGIVRDEKWDG